LYPDSQAKTLQYAEVDTSTERGKKQLETFKPVSADVQYSAVKIKTYPEGNVMR
jgi:allantoicase